MKIDAWNILLVEDDEDDYILTRAVLAEIKTRSIHLRWASSYESGLTELASNPVDALLVDYHLGADNGVEFMRAAVAQGCKAPFILVSGQSSYNLDLEATHTGFADYLVKGEINPVLLERSIRYAIEHQRMIIENEKARQVAEQAALDAQSRADELDAVIASMVDPVLIFDSNGILIRCNPSTKTAFGFEPNGMHRTMITEKVRLRFLNGCLVLEADLPSYRTSQSKTVKNDRFVFTNVAGEDRTIMTSASPLRRGSSLAGTVVSWRDVTEREALLTQVEAEESRLQAILQNAPDGIVVADREARILFTNPAADKLYGCPVPYGLEYSSHASLQISSPEGKPYHPRQLPLTRSALDGETFHNIELTIRKPDGRLTPIIVSSAPVRDRLGNLTGAVGIFKDITQIKLAEQLLNETQERLLMATEAADIGMWNRDLITDEISWNEKSIAMYGLPPGTKLRFPQLVELIHPEDRSALVEATQRAQDKTKNLEVEFRVIWPDGSVHWIYTKGNATGKADGSSLRLAGIDMDITRRKQNEEETRRNAARIEVQHHLMQQREMERQQIARDLHDGPIQELIGMTFTIQELLSLAQNAAFLDKLSGLQEVLQMQIRGLREFSGELRPPTLARFGLEKAIQAHAETFLMKHPDWKLKLQLAHDEELLPESVRLALFRIYQELLNNVLRHGETNEALICFTLDDNYATLEVRDPGRGFMMPQDWVEMARQGHLGLVGVQERAEAIGGSVVFESSPGKGTCVRVTIPLKVHNAQENVILFNRPNLELG